MSKLSDQTVGHIRFDLFSKNQSIKQVSLKYHVSTSTISRIYYCLSHQHSFTRFIGDQPVTHLVDAQYTKWLYTKAKRAKIHVNDLRFLIAATGGNCRLCKSQLVLAKQSGRPRLRTLLNVDHSHANGKVRDVLCGVCNLHLGRIEKRLTREVLKYLNLA